MWKLPIDSVKRLWFNLPVLSPGSLWEIKSQRKVSTQAGPLRQRIGKNTVRPKKVLIVEDSPIHLKLLREMLQLTAYEIVEAHDGEEALARILEVEPDLVLLDIHMPLLDGFAVIQHIRTSPRFSRLPVMAVTGCSTVNEEKRMLAAGFNSYVRKPVHPELLLAEMHKLMGGEEQLRYGRV